MPPWRQPFAITKYAIKLEQIKIIHFCLKIWDLCMFLHLFRLGLVCRWGVVPPQIAFCTFRPKKYVFCSCELPGKNFHVFKLESDRPCLDWQLIWFLTSWPIYDPFKSQPKWRQKCKIWLWHQFYHRTVNCRKICNAPLDALMCPLQIINDFEPLSSTLHGVNTHFIHHLSNVKNYSIGHKSETNWPKQKQKNGILENIFLHLYTGFGLKIQNTNGQKSLLNFFDICKIST